MPEKGSGLKKISFSVIFSLGLDMVREQFIVLFKNSVVNKMIKTVKRKLYCAFINFQNGSYGKKQFSV